MIRLRAATRWRWPVGWAHSLCAGEAITAVAVVMLALVLRLLYLGDKSLWVDEAYTVEIARRPFWRISSDLEGDHVPGYFMLMWATLRLIGDSEWAIRIPSALAGVCTVVAISAMGQIMERPRAGLLAALVFAASPFAIYWSQEAKPQAMAMAVAVLSSLFLLMAWRRDTRGWWAAYWLAGLIGLYTFYFHALVLAAQQIALFVASWRSGRFWRAASQVPVLLLVCAAFLPWVINQQQRLQFDVPTYGARLLSTLDYALFNANALVGGDPLAHWTFSEWTYLAGLISLLVIAGLALEDRRQFEGLPLLLLVAWIIVPLVGAYLIQLKVPNYQTRYLFAIVPAIALLFGMAVDNLLRPGDAVRIATTLAALTIVATLWVGKTGDVYEAPAYQHEGIREVSSYILAYQDTSDALISDPPWVLPGFRYYLGSQLEVRHTSPDPFDTIVIYDNAHLGTRLEVRQIPPYILDDVLALRRSLSVLQESGYQGIWLASYSNMPNRVEPVLATLAQPTEQGVEVRGVGVRYYRFERPVVIRPDGEASLAQSLVGH